VPNPPRLRRPPVLPKGPRLYSRTERVGGPGEPPEGFVVPPGSAEEWPPYWALAKIFRSPEDPRRPPFTGAPDGSWSYQTPFESGAGPVGSRIDYVCYFNGYWIGLRLQTAYWHVLADSGKQAYDAIQEAQLSGILEVRDIYAQDFVGADDNGQSAVVAVKDALQGIPRRDPILTGQGQQTRNTRAAT
jgi:hypothetical protein